VVLDEEKWKQRARKLHALSKAPGFEGQAARKRLLSLLAERGVAEGDLPRLLDPDALTVSYVDAKPGVWRRFLIHNLARVYGLRLGVAARRRGQSFRLTGGIEAAHGALRAHYLAVSEHIQAHTDIAFKTTPRLRIFTSRARFRFWCSTSYLNKLSAAVRAEVLYRAYSALCASRAGQPDRGDAPPVSALPSTGPAPVPVPPAAQSSGQIAPESSPRRQRKLRRDPTPEFCAAGYEAGQFIPIPPDAFVGVDLHPLTVR
jgi:hypothetical protein